MEEENNKKRHVCLTIWTWALQILIWFGFSSLCICIYYKNQFDKIQNKYPDHIDSIGAPYYHSNWKKNKMVDLVLPAFCILIISYIAYLITEFCTTSYKYLKNKKKDVTMYKIMEQLFYGHPIIQLKCVCYHFETHTEYYTDANGNRQSRTVTSQVNTHSDSLTIPYHSAIDISGKLVLNTAKGFVTKKDIVKLKLKLTIDYADAISYSDHDKLKSEFEERNKNYDKYMDVWEEKTLPGFNEYNLVTIGDNRSCFIHTFWYIFFTCLGFAQYYKWYIDAKCVHQSFNVIKLVSTRFNLLEENKYEKQQPKLDLHYKAYDFEASKTGFCEEGTVDLPLKEEIDEAISKYQDKVKKYSSISYNDAESDECNLNKNEENNESNNLIITKY